MTSRQENPETLSALDRPNSYIGKTVPRPNLDRLMQGRGLYVSDIELPRMAHVVFLRSPHAHAKINGIDASAAKADAGSDRRRLRQRTLGRHHAVGRRALAFEGPQIRAAKRDRD